MDYLSSLKMTKKQMITITEIYTLIPLILVYPNMLIPVLVGQAIIQHNMIVNIMMLIIKVEHQKIMKKIVGFLIQ